jgi:thioesterase III
MLNFETYHYDLLIREHHLDSFGHVNHATYLEILEEARWEFITSKGFGLEVVHRTGIGPVVLEMQIQFLREIRLRQPVRIESQLLSYEKKIGTLRQTILDDSNTICTQAKLVFGLFDMQARKLIMPTPAWLQAMGVSDALT